MKLLMIGAGLLFTMPTAFAQSPVSIPQEINLKVKPTDLETIGKALGKLPYDEVAPLIQSLRSQVIEQSKPPEQPKKE